MALFQHTEHPSYDDLSSVLTPHSYSLTDHIHEREISSQLQQDVAFIPHVAAWFQGIHHTISIPLNGTFTSRDIRNIYQERYEGEPLVKVMGESPLVKKIAGMCCLGSVAPCESKGCLLVSRFHCLHSVSIPKTRY